VALSAVALVLDGVDGSSPRTGSASAVGARFDMEVDAFLILVLSVFRRGVAGVVGAAYRAMRYVFVAAGWVMPWLKARCRRASPARPSRRPGRPACRRGFRLLPKDVSIAVVGIALACLVWVLRPGRALAVAQPAEVDGRPPYLG